MATTRMSDRIALPHHTSRSRRVYMNLLIVALSCILLVSCTMPLGEPRWSINQSPDSDAQFRLAVLTYDENGIAQAPLGEIELDDNPRVQHADFRQRVLSRLPSTCVYGEIIQFLQKSTPEVKIVDSGVAETERCHAVMSGNGEGIPEESFERFIGDAASLTLVVFVHGWKNSAAEDNGNLLQFKYALGKLATELDRINGRVYGIYLGWPGADYKGPLSYLRFWDRKRTSDEVSRTDLMIDLLRLQKLWQLDREKLQKTRPCSGSSCRALRLVVTGHSFGARIVFNVVQPFFVDGTLSNSVREQDGVLHVAFACKSARDQRCQVLQLLSPPDSEQSEGRPPGATVARYDETTRALNLRCANAEDCDARLSRIRSVIAENPFEIFIPDGLKSLVALTDGYKRLEVNAEAEEFLQILGLDGSSTYLPIPPTSENEENTTSQVNGFGDMVVLLNPAFEASRFLPLTEIQDAHTFSENQKNSLVVLSTENDTATKSAFPFARGIESGFLGGVNGKLARTTVGNYQSPVFTILNTRLVASNDLPGEEQATTECTRLSEERILPSICGADETTDATRDWCEAQQNKTLPFMVASTPKNFIDGHSDVFNSCVTDYLTRIVTRKLVQ